MNKNTTSQFMDKQIMDLSNSQTNNSNSNEDFIDFMSRPSEDHNRRKEDIAPSYDFLPIRPTEGSTSAPPPRSVNFDSGNDDATIRTRNSLDSKVNSSPVRNYSSLGATEPAKDILERDHNVIDASLVSEIDRTMKKYFDNLMHAMDGVSARLSQLETRTRNLESSVDDLKVSVGNNHGSTDGKLRMLENILKEVQTGVQFIMDKQEIVETQLQIAKPQVSKVEQHVENPNTSQVDSTQPGASAHYQAHQQLSAFPLMQSPPTLSLPNAPSPLPPQQNLPPQVQLPNQYPQNQVPSVPQRDSYFPQPPPGQTPENPSQQYQKPPVQPQQIAPPSPSLQQQYQSPPQQHYSQQPPPPQQHYSQQPPPPQQQYSQQSPPPQSHSTIPTVNPSQPQLSLGRHPEETPYIQPPTYPPSTRPPGPPPSHPSSGALPSQQFYGPPPNTYEPPSSRPNSVYSGSYDPSSSPGNPYYSGSPTEYGSGSPVKPQHHSSSLLGQSGGSGYPQLPTARILPQALPTASGVGGGSSSTGTGNRVPVDDVVDRVTSMGFPRDQVRATVRKLTESGQSVDLNVVLDKLMNDGDGQGPRGWFGR